MVHIHLVRMAGPIAGPVTAVVLVGLAIGAGHLVQALAAAQILVTLFHGADPAAIVAPLAVLAGVLLVRPALTLLRELAVQRTGEQVKIRLRTALLERIAALGPGHPAIARSGSAQSVVVDGIEGLEAYYGRYLPQLVTTGLTAVAVVALLSDVDGTIAALVAVLVVLVPLLPRLWDRLLAERGHAHWAAYRQLNAEFVDAMQGMPTLKSLNAAGPARARLQQRTDDLLAATLRQMRVSLVDSGVTAFGQALGAAVATVAAVVQVLRGALDPAALFVVLLLSGEAFRPFRELSQHWHAGFLGVSAAGSLRALRDAPVLVREPDRPRQLPPAAAGRRITYSGVGFTYPGRTRPALTAVDIEVPAGSTTAVVGRSGAGKTTLVSLLLRFLDPDTGTVAVDGVDVREMRPEHLRSQIAVVSQDTYLFHGTVAENLRLARPEASDREIEAAAAAANAAGFIEALPQGYESEVSERGLSLSGGQRQRIAIARALLKDAPILVLDEATSAVDGGNEADITGALRRLAAGRTTLVIAHRLSTVRDAARIVALDAGRVVESGTHDELLERCGFYAGLVDTQLAVRR